ncbi:hypothetical protein Tco_0594823 [Tanacetum coccineum]
MFTNHSYYLNDEYIVMTRNYFLQYTQLDIPEFCETLVQFMEYVKKSIDERTLHKMEYDSRVNERQTQTTVEKVEKVDTSKELDASLVIIESNRTESQEQDTSSISGNDAHVDDADIRPIYDEEPKAENVEQCHNTCPLSVKLTDDKTIELSNQLLESENVCLKKTVAQYNNRQIHKGNDLKVLVAEKTDISENRASRNFDLMINIMMSDHNSSDLAPQRQEIPLLEEYYNPAHGHAEDTTMDQALAKASFQEVNLSSFLYTGTRNRTLSEAMLYSAWIESNADDFIRSDRLKVAGN